MAYNTNLLECDVILKDALLRLKNYLVLAQTCNRAYENQFGNFNGQPRGYKIRVRQPTMVESVAGPTISSFDAIDQEDVEINADIWRTCKLKIATSDFQLSLNDFGANFNEPVASKLGNDTEIALVDAGMDTFSKWVGDPTTDIASFAAVNAAQSKLTKFGIPATDRYMCLSVKDYETLLTAMQPTYNEPLNKEISANATARRMAGFDLFQGQNVKVHTVGAYAGTVRVNGASQTGSSLAADGWTGNLKKGDRFTITGVNAVNPTSKVDLGEKMQFILTADVSATSPLQISPAIVTTGPYQNVTNAPADDAVINILGAASSQYFVGFAYHKTAFTLGCINLVSPRTAALAGSFGDADAKLAISMSGMYDGLNRVDQYRYDILLAAKAFPEYGTAIVSRVV